jgi:uncharacterized protein (DUF58 family)
MRAGTNLFIMLLVFFVLGILTYFSSILFIFWELLFFMFVFFLIADFIILRFFTGSLSVSREMPSNLKIGVRVTVRLGILRKEHSVLYGKIKIFDIYDDRFDCDDFPIAVRCPKDSTLFIEYNVLPVERGDWAFSVCDILLNSPLHFWRRKIRHHTKTKGRIYPSFGSINLGNDIHSIIELSGGKMMRKRGIGLEFESLRDWQVGDSIRSIDWRATSRRRQAIVREYIEEQDQHILILLDSGFRLHRPVDADSERNKTGVDPPSGIIQTQFDFALNSALILAYIALKHGDSVAAQVFGNNDRWIPPHKGINALPRLINKLYDVQSASVPSSIFYALEKTLGYLTRRTFIVCISNFREEDAEELSRLLPLIGRRHLLLMVSLCEKEAETLRNDNDVLTAMAAENYIVQRKKLYKKWEHMGLLALDTSASLLSAKLINSYLNVKRQGLL